MNVTTGEIRDMDTGPQKEGEIRITELERQYLEMFKPEDRRELLLNMRSKNKAAKRRARKKIARASQQRNRK